MKKLGLLLSLVLILAFPSVAGAQALHQGDYDTRSIDRYTATYDIHADGTTDVTIDFLFNFNAEPGHGVYFQFPVSHHPIVTGGRLFPITNVHASSPSGAPADVLLEESDGWLNVRIGDADRGDITGVQEYVLTYTVKGTLNETMASELDSSVAPAEDWQVSDEFYWDVIGPAWEVPFDNVTIIVKGDASATDLRCYTGVSGSQDGCTSAALADGVATFTQDHLDPFVGLNVAVAFPVGSFDTTPIFATTPIPSLATTATLITPSIAASSVSTGSEFSGYAVPFMVMGAGLLALIVVGTFFLVRGSKRKTEDGSYSDLGPGFISDDPPWRGQGNGLL